MPHPVVTFPDLRFYCRFRDEASAISARFSKIAAIPNSDLLPDFSGNVKVCAFGGDHHRLLLRSGISYLKWKGLERLPCYQRRHQPV